MRIKAIEFQLGSRVETLEDLGAANPEWNVDRLLRKTGIAQHHVSGPDETPLSLAVQACETLFETQDRAAIDGLIYVTQSPEPTIPTTACLLHERLGLDERCLAFDLNQGCSGFVYGLSVASALLRAGELSQCLLVCAEAYNKYISRHDRTCRPIFSDGASAVLLDSASSGEIGPFVFATDGAGAPNLTLTANDGIGDVDGKVLYMNGPKVLDFTMEAVPEAVDRLLAKAQLSLSDIDLFVFHQASKVVLDRIQKSLDIDAERLFRNYSDVGNTVSATIPVALKQAQADRRLRPGMTVLMMGFGVGYSLAGCIAIM
ncbi:MAG: ketoacyl-ACP synthase III [Alphaproteobacteria bacterium]|jgi:3-oxoacyl-[acyl-carrier-protein] synthase-3|nr:ketoacyl-ACP synthase III [Alphaproteobacteria bacterium]MDP6515392.1 ketoacyl-ACP synthase III [Alphaproteobacteria bacterium]